MDSQPVREKPGNKLREASLLEWVLIAISLVTICAVILIVLDYGSKSALPLPTVFCNTEAPKSVSSKYLYTPYQQKAFGITPPFQFHTQNLVKKNKDCYKVSDVLSLNKAVRITDAIGLVTLLLTLFGVVIPLVFYINIQKNKEEIEKKFILQENEVNKGLQSLHKNEVSLNNKIDHEIRNQLETLEASIKKQKFLLEENTNKSVKKSLSNISVIGGNIESFKTQYLYSLGKEGIDSADSTEFIAEIATNLYQLLSQDQKIKGILDNILSIFRPELFNLDAHFKMYAYLKYTLRTMYEMGIFDTKEKEEALESFSMEVFKVPLRTLLRHEDAV